MTGNERKKKRKKRSQNRLPAMNDDGFSKRATQAKKSFEMLRNIGTVLKISLLVCMAMSMRKRGVSEARIVVVSTPLNFVLLVF